MRWNFFVVDPDPADAQRAAAAIQKIHPDANVQQIASGADALAAIDTSTHAPSLVLYEFDVPDLDAISFLGELRQRRWPSPIPVAILSNSDSEKKMMTCYRLGARAFLRKPVDLRELRETVRDFAQPATRAGDQPRSVA